MPERGQDVLLEDPGGMAANDPRWIPLMVALGMGGQTTPGENPFRILSDQQMGFGPGFTMPVGGAPGGGAAAPSAAAGGAPAGAGAFPGWGGTGAVSGAGATGGGAVAGGTNWANWINAAGALLGAYSGYDQARQSGRPQTVTTDQTTSQGPYMGDALNEHLMRILSGQQAIFEGGPRGGGGGGRNAGLGQYGQQAGDVFGRVAEAGLGAGQTPNMMLAQNALGGLLGPQGATGFEGNNPILADLARRMGGVGLDMPTDLLMGFLSGGSMGGGAGAGGGGGSFRFGGGGGGGGGVLPDTGAGGGTFQRELDRIFSEEANEEEIAAVLDGLRGDMERSLYAGIRDIEARAAGAGRLGGSEASAEGQNARARYVEKLGSISAQLRSADLNDRRNARIAALNLLNTRDISAMNDLTQRAGIQSAAGSAAANTAMARELGIRGQDLEAIMGIMQGQQFGLSTLAGLGERLSGDRLGALSLIPGLEGVGLQGQQNALGAGGGLSGLEEQQQQARARAQANAQRQAGMPQQMLNDYLRTIMGIGSLGGTSTTQGTNVVPGTGISTGAGAAQGALGGYLATRGLQRGY